MNIALRRFLHNHGNIATEGSPKPELCPTLISNDFMVFFIVHSTPRLQAPVGTNEPSRPAPVTPVTPENTWDLMMILCISDYMLFYCLATLCDAHPSLNQHSSCVLSLSEVIHYTVTPV